VSRADKPQPRFEINRTWILRAILVAIAIALIALIVKVAGMAVSDGRARTDRVERAVDSRPAAAERSTAPATAR
jgi:hypothetical protein